jgi:hypothetical protein
MQEESFSKMQIEIEQLQSKIRGLESKLSPSYSKEFSKNDGKFIK